MSGDEHTTPEPESSKSDVGHLAEAACFDIVELKEDVRLIKSTQQQQEENLRKLLAGEPIAVEVGDNQHGFRSKVIENRTVYRRGRSKFTVLRDATGKPTIEEASRD